MLREAITLAPGTERRLAIPDGTNAVEGVRARRGAGGHIAAGAEWPWSLGERVAAHSCQAMLRSAGTSGAGSITGTRRGPHARAGSAHSHRGAMAICPSS